MLERMGQTEMRVGVTTTEFGNIELRANVVQDHVGATVLTSHADLRVALAVEAPSLEQAMAQHHLRLDALDLNARSAGQDGGGTPQQQARQYPPSSSNRYAAADDRDPPLESAAVSRGSAPHSLGLSVLA
ncbi:MAG TPA: flagellar hook-length control protein FliK [Chloroflexota bacterium]|nr:flagellar hook-length control protein FliK [Chloroflexota bacterium]